MSKSIKNKKIVFLFPSNAIKSKIVINSIKEHGSFYCDYDLFFCFDAAVGQNVDFAKKHKFKYIIINKEHEINENIDYDFIISCGWGWKIPDSIISRSKIASLNCHSSLLPDYKGGSVYNYYWANCEDYAGASVHYLSNEFDKGNILAQEKISISKEYNPKGILEKVSYLTSVLIRESILKAERGDHGDAQVGGRYFYKTNRYKLILHRVVNKILKSLGFKQRWMTPHKIDNVF